MENQKIVELRSTTIGPQTTPSPGKTQDRANSAITTAIADDQVQISTGGLL